MTFPTATILIVDDTRQSRDVLEALLGQEGYLTETASDGASALAAIARHAPDLVGGVLADVYAGRAPRSMTSGRHPRRPE